MKQLADRAVDLAFDIAGVDSNVKRVTLVAGVFAEIARTLANYLLGHYRRRIAELEQINAELQRENELLHAELDRQEALRDEAIRDVVHMRSQNPMTD